METVQMLLLKEVYQKPEFNRNFDNQYMIRSYVRKMPVTFQSFEIIEGLMDYYGFGFLINLKIFYDRIQMKEMLDYENRLERIAQKATAIIDPDHFFFEELEFLMQYKTSGKNQPILWSASNKERDFKRKIQHLGTLFRYLKASKGRSSDSLIEQIVSQFDKNCQEIVVSNVFEREYVRQLQFNFNDFKKNSHSEYLKQLGTQARNDYLKQLTKMEKPQHPIEKSSNKKQMKYGTYLKNTIEELSIKSSINEIETQQMKETKSIPLCCRTFFTVDEQLEQAENLRIEYKGYHFPFTNKEVNILRKAVCGFLNTEGGTIYIGIREVNQTKERYVMGAQYTEAEKQRILKELRHIAESMRPDILTNRLYSVVFVPVKAKIWPYEYVQGLCVIKMVIRYGNREDIYGFIDEKYEYQFCFRTENEVLTRDAKRSAMFILKTQKERAKNPLPIPYPLHQGPCKQPEPGKQLYHKPRK